MLPVERDVGKVVLGGFDLVGVFFVIVAHVADLGMPEDGIVVEAEFGVQTPAGPLPGDHQRIDLQHGAVAGDEGACRVPARTLTALLVSLPVRPRLKAILRHWKGVSPTSGSIASVKIFSGVVAATSSISIPPSVEAMTVTFEVPGRPAG